MLIDITHNQDKQINPKKEEHRDLIQHIKNKLPTNTFTRMIKTIDEAIEHIIQVEGKLTWTKAGALFGFKSKEPLVHINHLWENIIKIVGDDKECLYAVGALLKWRISLRTEDWVVYKQDQGSIDPVTGKEIAVAEYWIPTKKGLQKATGYGYTIQDLANKFNNKK